MAAGHLRDGLPNAAGPVLSVAGFTIGTLLVGTVVVEQIFGWPGLGAYFVRAAAARDVPALQASALILGGGFILANRLADVLQVLVDPRSRSGSGAHPRLPRARRGWLSRGGTGERTPRPRAEAT